MTSDQFSSIASLESALAQEKASHTDTLVKLRLTEEALKASEAERERLRAQSEATWRGLSDVTESLVEAEEFESKLVGFFRKHGETLLRMAVDAPGELSRDLDVLLMAIEIDYADDEPTLRNNERPEP